MTTFSVNAAPAYSVSASGHGGNRLMLRFGLWGWLVRHHRRTMRGDPPAHRLIDIAQQAAELTCEQCGVPVEMSNAQRWTANCTVCPVCASGYKAINDC